MGVFRQSVRILTKCYKLGDEMLVNEFFDQVIKSRPAGKKDQYGLLRPLQTPSNYIEAQMSLQKLTDANIKATLTQTLDGPQLMVFEKDLKIAQTVLKS